MSGHAGETGDRYGYESLSHIVNLAQTSDGVRGSKYLAGSPGEEGQEGEDNTTCGDP